MSYWSYRSVRYRYWCRTELTEVFGAGVYVVPNLPKCPVPVLMSYRTYTEVSGIGIDVVPSLPKCPVPALWSHRTYRSVYAFYQESVEDLWYLYTQYHYLINPTPAPCSSSLPPTAHCCTASIYYCSCPELLWRFVAHCRQVTFLFAKTSTYDLHVYSGSTWIPLTPLRFYSVSFHSDKTIGVVSHGLCVIIPEPNND